MAAVQGVDRDHTAIPHDRRRRVATVATATALGAVALTVWWSGGSVNAVGVAVLLGTAGALGFTARIAALAPLWDRFGFAVGSVLVAVLVALTGGAESNYKDMFLIVPVASALLLPPRLFAASLATAAAGALLPVLYDGAGRAFVADAVADAAVWAAASLVVLAQTQHSRRQERALRRADHLKSMFLQAVSHELRTPMTVIQGVAKTLHHNDDRLTCAQRSMLVSGLEHSATRLSGLVADLLDVDRLLRGTLLLSPDVVDLADVVADVVATVAPGEHTVRVDARPAPAVIDRPKIERVVEHLVVNAVKHTPPATDIRVTVDGAGGTARLVVEDDGPGVPDALKRRVFEPFEQGPDSADAPSPGTGIGLALVARMVEAHDGRVWIEDSPGGGARFCVELPAADADRPARAR